MSSDDVHVEGGLPLLDAVDIQFGPRSVLSRFFLLAEEVGRLAGVDIQIHSDLATLVEANLQLQSSWGPLVPTYDPALSDLSADTSFWVSAHNPSGAVVASCAARRMTIGSGGFAEALTSLKVFYADPSPYAARGMTCSIMGPANAAARSIKGVINHSGAQWCRPDYRGRGINQLLARISRFLGLARWDVEYLAAVTRVDLRAKNVLQVYGYRRSDRLIEVRNSYRGDFDLSLIWMDRAEIEADLEIYVAVQSAKVVRDAEAEDTTMPSPVIQGSMRRS